LDVITLHRDEARHAFFAEASARPIFFDPTIDAWVVADPRQCEAILQSPDVKISPYASSYEDMAARNPRFAFPNLIFSFKYIPLCTNGGEHRLARRRLAAFVASRRNITAAATPDIVDRWVGVLAGRSQIELMTELLEPMVKEFLAVLNGVDSTDLVLSISTVFDRMLGATKRRKLDEELGAIRTHIRATLGPDVSEDEEGVRLALFVLGNDALAGGFGESLYQLFRANPGRSLAEIDYPAVPNETGVPFAERIVTGQFECNGVTFRPGDRIRVMLQSFAYSGSEGDAVRVFVYQRYRGLRARLANSGSKARSRYWFCRLPKSPLLRYQHGCFRSIAVRHSTESRWGDRCQRPVSLAPRSTSHERRGKARLRSALRLQLGNDHVSHMLLHIFSCRGSACR
jgi:hypothetical protein